MRILVVCVLVIASVVWAEYPANIPKCKNGDAPCIAQVAQNIIQEHFTGIREVNLAPFEPLHIKTLVLERNPSGPVTIDFQFKDVDLIGLKNMQVKSFTGLSADLSGRTTFEAVVPEVHLKGPYKMEGRVLLLPIVGDGTCDITLKNVHLVFSTDLKPVEKNGQIYAVLEHVKLDLDAQHVHFELDNLFNGDKTLGESMNKVLNDSWKEIFGELKPNLAKALSLVVKQLVNAFLDKHPYADHFL